MSLEDNGGSRLTPTYDADEYDVSSGNLYQMMQYSANNIYGCENKTQLIKYYHASLCLHPKRTLSTAAKAGYLQGFPSLNAVAVNRHVGVEDATKMGHMRQAPGGTISSTTTTNRGRPAGVLRTLELEAAADDAMAMPEQEVGNVKTKKVFMTVKLADGWIASDQTDRLPRVSIRGNQYICVFYIYDANFIKGITIKSRHRSDLLGAYESVSLHGDTWTGRWTGAKFPVSRPVPVQQNDPRPAPLQLPSTRSCCPPFSPPSNPPSSHGPPRQIFDRLLAPLQQKSLPVQLAVPCLGPAPNFCSRFILPSPSRQTRVSCHDSV